MSEDTHRISVKGNEIQVNDMIYIGGELHFVQSTEPIGTDYTKLKVSLYKINFANLSNTSYDHELTITNDLHFNVTR